MTVANDLRSRLVIGQKRDGRREYDEEARDELIHLCLNRGVSIARTAMEHDINPNLLRTWVTQYRQRQAATESVAKVSEVSDEAMIDIAVPAALTMSYNDHAAPFVAVAHAATPPSAAPPPMTMSLALHVRLSNGVELELGSSIATIDELTTVVQILGRLPCSGSTKS
ncbi:transposase [Caballeronia sordidicola]|uniref:transposase n=1 Tax=Caballeronia sordidicola TaxID=196367 RepID=UPI00094DB082|nr:transposase [Caballeronia sordidicola]